MELKKPDKIGGHLIPKWQADEESLSVVIDNIQNKSDISPEQLAQEKANELRSQMGICNKCRLRNCLCKEGQI